MAQLRYAQEVGAIELAVRAATDEQIERLGQIEQELEQSLREDTSSSRHHLQTRGEVRKCLPLLLLLVLTVGLVHADEGVKLVEDHLDPNEKHA